MKELSIQGLEVYAKKKGWRLSDDAQKAVNFGKTSKLLDKMIQAIGGLIRTILMLEESFSRKLEADAKFDRQLIQALERVRKGNERVKEWTFTIERNKDGSIKKVVARGK